MSYNAPPVMLSGGGAGAKPDRGSKTRGYSQYAFFAGPGGWGDHHMGGSFYGPGFGVHHMPMMRGHMGMEPGIDYMAEQFQGETTFLCACHVTRIDVCMLSHAAGLALGPGAGYYNHSPPSGGQFPGMGGMDHVTSGAGGSYSPPHNLSPKGVVTSAGINGYNSVSAKNGCQTECLEQSRQNMVK